MNDKPTYERRTFDMEFTVEQKHRSSPPTLRGYASVFNQIDGPAGSREMVAPGAFTRSLREGNAVTALWNHNPDFVIASTKNGSLKLTEDDHGLLAEMTPIDTPTIRDLVVKPIQDGLVNKMSFGFETVSDEYTTDKQGPLRVLRDLTLYDVSPVVFPWYEGTDISARGRKLASWLTKNPDVRADALIDELLDRLAAGEAASNLTQHSDVDVQEDVDHRDAEVAGAIAARVRERELYLRRNNK